MLRTLGMMAVVHSMLTASPSAVAGEDEDLPSVEECGARPEVFLITDVQKKECTRSGGVCFYSGGGGTYTGVDVNPTVGIVTTIARGTQVAGPLMSSSGEPERWRVEMVARLKAKTTSGPIIVAILDYADPEGMARKEATTVWEVTGAPTKDLGMRFALSSEYGFQSKHTYALRVVQAEGPRERVLAEGDFMLK